MMGNDTGGDRSDWIVLTALYGQDQFGRMPQRLVLIDFYDPATFRVLARDSIFAAKRSRISPDGRFVVFENNITGLGSSPLISVMEIETEKSRPLYLYPEAGGSKIGLQGQLQEFAWDPEGTGFYAATRGPAEFGAYTYYYDLAGRGFEPVGEPTYRTSVFPYGLKGRDSLIVFSDAPSAPGRGKGYFFMTPDGHYLSRIENPHLGQINRDGTNKKAPYFLAWNDELGLFAYSQVDSTVSGFKIAVTNLDGSYYQTYTSGEYLDRRPVWGPNNTILFERVRPQSPGGWKDFRVMVLDRESGEIRQLVDPSVIDGAVALRYPDY